VDHTPAVNSVAPERSTATATAAVKPIPWIEKHVGSCVADAALTILQALDEHKDGRLIPKTREQIGEAIWMLFRLHRTMVPLWDFDAIAREQGTAALRAADVAPAIAQIAIDEVLRVLHAVIRATVN